MARASRTRLQGGEYGSGTPQGRADFDGRRTRATELAGASIANGAAPRASRTDRPCVRGGPRQPSGREAPADVGGHRVQVARALYPGALGWLVRRTATWRPPADQRCAG